MLVVLGGEHMGVLLSHILTQLKSEEMQLPEWHAA